MTNRRKFIKQAGVAGIAGTIPSALFAQRMPEQSIVVENDKLLNQSKKTVCIVKKEVRVACPQLRLAPINNMGYIGRGSCMEETLSFMQSSDWSLMGMRRTSEDNGHTWTDWATVPIKTQTTLGQYTQTGGASQSGTGPYDPVSGQLVKPVFQRIFRDDPKVALKEVWKGNRYFWDHGFYQLSGDDGKTWRAAHQLKYEEGPDFDPSDWGNQKWLTSNEMYIGNSIVLKNGSVVISATVPVPYRDKEDEKYPSVFPNNYREGCVAGVMCFIGRWNKPKADYRWEKSNSIFLPRQMSSRGVGGSVSELKNGNLLIIMRGSDTIKTPGRKWYSVSKDGGLTWSDIKDMQYDSGEQFYSPASDCQTIRSSKTGKLYWIGNICNEPPKGNRPRYPLQIVEVDEDRPSLKKGTVTVIDDRDPERDSELVQFSNFSLIENRETKEMELYMTRLGENVDTWRANAYKYTLEF